MMREEFSKCFRPGHIVIGRMARPVFVFVKFTIDGKHGRLSFTGVEGPRDTGNAFGACGQIDLDNIDRLGDGWDWEQFAKLRKLWKRWHLNDMRAGSPAQEAYLRSHPIDSAMQASNGGGYYMAACAILTRAGLDPDMELMHNRKHYSYGCDWLSEAIPDGVFKVLHSLPECDIAAVPERWRK